MQGEMGATLHTGDMSVDDLLQYAQEAERLGYEGFWLTEESGKEAFAVLALLLVPLVALMRRSVSAADVAGH